MKRIVLPLLAVVLLTACGSPEATGQPTADPLGVEGTASIELTSSAFAQGQPIPAKYACEGEDISPPLAWGEPPAGTRSFAIIMDDPDAPGGTWVHWVFFNISPSIRSLPEAFPAGETFPDGSLGGKNSWGNTGYGGPCPPSGTHRYFFKLYALDEMLAINPDASKGELEKAMVGHILAYAELMGTFTK